MTRNLPSMRGTFLVIGRTRKGESDAALSQEENEEEVAISVYDETDWLIGPKLDILTNKEGGFLAMRFPPSLALSFP